MKFLAKEKRDDTNDAFNYINNIHFEQMVHRFYRAELQLNKANDSDTESAFLDEMIQFLEKYMSLVVRKPVFGVSD